jgi:uncharacterized Zn finger protein
VAERREQARRAVANATKSGQSLAPVVIEGRNIAKTFWGKAWCQNLESYSDFANRLPRGRTYVRNGSVIDLKIEPGKVRARVVGSSLYEIEIRIAAVQEHHWKALTRECTGSIASLVELLQGQLSNAVMENICRAKTGLFPAPKDIGLKCSCPDWATMCKHIAAVLYGVGVRLDQQPGLLFKFRQVDAAHLVTRAAELPMQMTQTSSKSNVLDDAALADVFGIEMATADTSPVTTKKLETRRPKSAVRTMAPAMSAIVSKTVTEKRATKKKATRKTAIAAKPKQTATPSKKANTLVMPKPRLKRMAAD